MKRKIVLVILLIVSISCCSEGLVFAKSNTYNYDTCFLDAYGKVRQIKKISVKGNKLTVMGTLKRGNKILYGKKRVFKIAKKAKFYMAEGRSMIKMSKRAFSQSCAVVSQGTGDGTKAFCFKVKKNQVIKLVYYP